MAAAGAFPSVNIGFSTGGKVMTNSPFNLHSLIMVYCVFCVQLTAAAMGQAIHQDYASQTTALFFTTSLTSTPKPSARRASVATVTLTPPASVR